MGQSCKQDTGMNKEVMFTSTLEECTQSIYDGDILLAKSVGKGPQEKWKKIMTSAIWGVQCQTLSVTFTPRTSLKDIRGHSNRIPCNVLFLHFHLKIVPPMHIYEQ